MTDYIVNQTKQIGIQADGPEDALKKVLNGEGTLISVNASAQPRSPQVGTAAARLAGK